MPNEFNKEQWICFSCVFEILDYKGIVTKDKRVFYAGTWVDGKLSGEGKIFIEDSGLYEGSVNDVPNG